MKRFLNAAALATLIFVAVMPPGQPSVAHATSAASADAAGQSTAAAFKRCETAHGAVLYQQAPCPDGTREVAVGKGTVTQVDALPADKIRAMRKARPKPRQGGVGIIARGEDHVEPHPKRCAALRATLDRVDASARRQSTTALQERRRQTLERMHALRCKRIDR